MIRQEKWQAFICILISLLLYGLIWSGLLPNVGEPNQVKVLSFVPFKESPLRDRESCPAPLPLWQVDQSNIAFIQNVTVISSNKAPTRSSGYVRSALCYGQDNKDSGHAQISLYLTDNPNTAFKFPIGQTYQHLDIPPPHALASL